MHGDVGNLKQLLRRREASVFDIRDKDGVSLLYVALLSRKFIVAEMLLREGADLFQLNDAGQTAAFEVAVRLLYTDINLESSPRLMLESALPMDVIIETLGLTGLHQVAMGISCLRVEEYLANSAHRCREINAIDTSSQLPIYYASARGDVRAVQALLEAGACPDMPFSSAYGPLHIACRNRHVEVVQQLLDAEANVCHRGGSFAPLQALFTLDNGRVFGREESDKSIEIIRKLLHHGANINAVDGLFHSTALDLASNYNYAAVVNFMVASGADLDHRDWEGTNALGNAILGVACDTADVLLKHGASYQNIDENELGVLHYLAIDADIKMLELFIAWGLRGLDIGLQDAKGRTPFQICSNRADANDHLKRTFVRLLDSVSREKCVMEDDYSDSSDDEFVDALED